MSTALQPVVDETIEAVSGPMADVSVREKIEALEAHWLTLPQVDIPVVDLFFGGIYAREIVIPADTFLTGRVYLDDHFDIMVYGDVTVSSDDGKKRLQGFNMLPGTQGKKRAGYVHEETKWITFCASPELIDGAYLESLTCDSFAEMIYRLEQRDFVDEEALQAAYEAQPEGPEYNAFRAGYLAASGKVSRQDFDREDFDSVLREYGFTHETVAEQTAFEGDRIDIGPPENFGISLSESSIAGQGIFAARQFENGDTIAPARVGDLRTFAGWRTNHSGASNAVMVPVGDDIILTAARRIKPGDEITVNYRESLTLLGVRPCQA